MSGIRVVALLQALTSRVIRNIYTAIPVQLISKKAGIKESTQELTETEDEKAKTSSKYHTVPRKTAERSCFLLNAARMCKENSG